MDRKYGRMLEWSLAHRRAMLAVSGVVVAVGGRALSRTSARNWCPDDDQSEFSVNVRLPRGTSFQRTLEYVTPIEGEIRTGAGRRRGVGA